MDFSRPDNARNINRLKVLSALRGRDDMSCAELSRTLLINKVSIGEIVKKLIEEDLVKEDGKIIPVSGRPATRIRINEEGGEVIALSVEGKAMKIAVSDLSGRICRLERFPKGGTAEETKENLSSAFMRLERGSKLSVTGAVIAGDEDLSWLTSLFPFPVKTLSTTLSRARAEVERCEINMTGTLFIDLSEKAEAILYDGDYKALGNFSDITTDDGRRIGDVFTLSRIWRDYGPIRRDRVWESEEITLRMKAELPHLSSVIGKAVEVLSPRRVMIIGALSGMQDNFYAFLNEKTEGLAERDLPIFKSLAGESGILEGAAILALDEFFYKTELLRKLSELESL